MTPVHNIQKDAEIIVEAFVSESAQKSGYTLVPVNNFGMSWVIRIIHEGKPLDEGIDCEVLPAQGAPSAFDLHIGTPARRVGPIALEGGKARPLDNKSYQEGITFVAATAASMIGKSLKTR